jgi:hypothetical protein
MATVPTQGLDSAGAVGTYVAATAGAGGDRVAPGSLLHIKNRSGGSINVIKQVATKYDGDLTITGRTIAVGTGEANDKFVPIGDAYRDPADGLCLITWSAVTSVTFAVVRD